MRRTAADAARTRSALLDAALLVFAETGVANARLADIATRAGATRGAVYHHFEDKAALHAAVLNECWDTLTVEVWAELESEGLAAFLIAWLRLLREDERFRALLTITMSGRDPMPPGADEVSAKAWGLDDWLARLTPVAGENATHLLSWLCGTAMVATAAPGLLPPADADGVAPLLRGMLG
ncbi:TetR family transcriptional regulator [Kutzneria sp. CA-103260]|uniref:TetR family transcriptional regulator n=1 Tax=Kutzneria sp. CA-103260 TaxID=2802641 RepID=UPI001BA7FC82|nr:TetR family transcriptional regulator [Kutzneria sp. CA-103260]QUQ63706.1 HTH-type transcriptional regulator BetI [Kutzneria sp. CA-103260]